MKLKIVSWNVWCYNKNFNQIIRFIKKENAQIYCLQEVSLELLNKLKELDYNLVIANEQTIVKKNNFKEFIVILSKNKIINQEHHKFKNPKTQSLRSKLVGFKGSLEYQFIDIEVDNQFLRIFNSHLQFNAGPTERVLELKKMKSHLNRNAINIFCGDFNNFGIWYYNLLIGWALNYSLKDYFLNGNQLFNDLFKKSSLNDVFKGEETFPQRHLQLDHILVPKNIKLLSKKVINGMYGSDHKPIKVELEI